MRRLFLWAGRLIALLFSGSILIATIVLLLAMQSLPDYDAQYSVTAITAPVTITRDANAIPHISGTNDLDVFFGLGFTHAQDRAWQMNMSRRLAQGRLSEIVGSQAMNSDSIMRALDLTTYAKATYKAQPERTKQILKAYSQGVNAWINTAGNDSLSKATPEFLFSKSIMELWQPHDSVLLLKSMDFFLSSGVYKEIERTRFALSLKPDNLEDLFPSDLETNRSVWKDYAKNFRSSDFSQISNTPLPRAQSGASNVWAVDASRTAYGASILASDPHLSLSAPAIWYMAHLQLPNAVNIIGATMPGIPIVSIGHNGRTSWGISASQIDNQDIYFEKLNPKNPEQYLTPDGYKAFNTREIKIGIKAASPIVQKLRWSRHGPVLPESFYNLGDIIPEGHVAALQWTALTADDVSITAALELMQSQSLVTAKTAVQKIDSPSLNIVIADEKRVGMLVTGRIPRRSISNTTKGRLPAEGWLPKNDWLGFVDTVDKPQNMNPRSGTVANANNRTTNKNYPKHLSFDWAEPYRIKRIDKLLNAREYHTLQSFITMQNDTVSEMARTILPLTGATIWWNNPNREPIQNDILDRLKAWNGDMNEHQMEPLIFVHWMRALTQLITQDELGPLQRHYTGIKPLFLERVFTDTDGAGRWCDIIQTSKPETCAEIAEIALKQSIDRLSQQYGTNPDLWRWGKAHEAIHRHIPYGYAPVLEWFFNIRQETSGGDETIMRGLTPGRGPRPDENVHASGYKMVVDFNDLQRSQFIVSTGQSGHPLSRHYDDMSEKWRTGQYVPMLLEADDIQAGSIGTVTLTPHRSGE